MRGVDFSQAENITGVDFRESVLRNTNFRNTKLTGADFSRTNLSKANLHSANLEAVLFSGADLSSATLARANADGANFRGANLSKINASKANFSDVCLQRANCAGANFQHVKFLKADLRFANLQQTQLDHSDFNDALISDAEIDEITLCSRNISGVRLGINGIWNEISENGAIVSSDPAPGELPVGHARAITRMLTRARKFNGVAMSIAIVAFLLAYSGVENVQIPLLQNLTIHFTELVGWGMLVEVVLASQVWSFLTDAFKGAGQLSKPKAIALVGNFPWQLTRQISGGNLRQTESLVNRLVQTFFPLLFLVVGLKIDVLLRWWFLPLLSVQIVFAVMIFTISKRFQQPFFAKRYLSQRLLLERLINSVSAETKEILALIRLFRSGKEVSNKSDVESTVINK